MPTARSPITPMRMPASRARRCAMPSERSASHCRKQWNSTSRSCDAAKTATAALFGSRRSIGQRRQSPAPSRALHGMQRFEHGVLRQQLAAVGAEAGKVQHAAAVHRSIDERFEQRPQQPMLGACGRRPVDQRLRLQPLERLAQPFGAQRVGHMRLAEHQRRRCVQRIEEQPRRRRIWPEARRIGTEQRMQRAQRQGIRAARSCCLGKCRDARRVADPAIAAMTQRIDLRRDAPQPCVRHRIVDACGSGSVRPPGRARDRRSAADDSRSR